MSESYHDFTETMALEEILEAVARMAEDEVREPGEFTAREYAAHKGIGVDTANGQLNRLVAKKMLTVRGARVNGKRANLYKIVVGP